MKVDIGGPLVPVLVRLMVFTSLRIGLILVILNDPMEKPFDQYQIDTTLHYTTNRTKLP